MKLRFIVLFLLLSVFMLFGSCSQASWAPGVKEEFFSNIDKLYNGGLITEDIKNHTYNYINTNNMFNVNFDLTDYFIIYGHGNNNTYNPKMPTTDYLYFTFFSGPVNMKNYTNNTINALYNNWVFSDPYQAIWSRTNDTLEQNYSAHAFNNLVEPFYCYTTVNIDTRTLKLNAGEEYGGNYITSPPYSGPVFTPSNNGTIQVFASNNVSENMIRLPFTYTGQSDWTLGYLTDYDDVYSIFGYFGPLFYRDGQLYTESYQNQFSYNIYSGTNNNGLLFDSSTGRISIKREKLLNKQGYNLLLTYRSNNGDSLEDIGDFNYYAYFYNLSISSGDLVSPDINSSVDIGMINALDDYFNYTSGDSNNLNYNINELLNFSGDLFSGDLFSGDIFNKIGYNDHYTTNQYSITLYDFYRRIIGVLLDDSTSSYIEFEYRGNTYRFYSNDFKTPDSAFKTFISGFIIVLFSIGIIKRLAVLFKRMAVLDYVGISSSFDVDDSNFL